MNETEVMGWKIDCSLVWAVFLAIWAHTKISISGNGSQESLLAPQLSSAGYGPAQGTAGLPRVAQWRWSQYSLTGNLELQHPLKYSIMSISSENNYFYVSVATIFT